MATLAPQGKQQYTTATGVPLAGGLLYTYAAGTSTPLATYSDQAGTVPNANPVVLNSRGEATIFWGPGPYKVALHDAADVQLWTQDNVYPPASSADLTSATGPLTARLDGGVGTTVGSALVTATSATTPRTLAARAADVVNVRDYGAVGDAVTDDTSAVQAAVAAALAIPGNAALYIPHGQFRCSHIDINGANGLKIISHGSLIGKTSGSYESVLTIRNANDVSLYGKLNISGQNNQNYGAGVLVYTDNGTQSAQMDLHNISVDSVQIGFQIGRSSEPHGLVAELSFFGGHTWNVPQAVVAYGTQTFVHFVGSKLSSDQLGGFGQSAVTITASGGTSVTLSDATAAVIGGSIQQGGPSGITAVINDKAGNVLTLDRTVAWSNGAAVVTGPIAMGCVRAVGATVYVDGGELLFPGTPPNDGINYGVEIQPISDPIGAGGFGNYYGSVYVTNTEVEVEAQHKVVNPNSITVPSSPLGVLSFQNAAGYHARDAFAFIYVYDDTFPGKVIVQSSPFLYASPTHVPGTTRTSYNVACAANAIADVFVDEASFGSGFIQGLQGISGGIAHFSNRRILHAYDVGALSVTTSGTTLKFASLESTADTNRFGSSYNASTGVFTVPTGGLRSIRVSAALATTTPSTGFDLYVLAGGSTYYLGTWPGFGGVAGLGYLTGSVSLFDQPAGNTIQVIAKTYGSNETAVSGFTVFMDIWASR